MAQPKPQESRSWIAGALSALGVRKQYAQEVDTQGFGYADALTLTALMGNGVQAARARQQLYQKWQQMTTDPLIAGSMRIHVQAALGGDENNGDMVFVEPTAKARADKSLKKMVDEIAAELAPLLNRIAVPTAYNGVCYGDGYARLYTKRGKGVTDACANEMMLPPLIQPYEVGNETKVCVVAIGQKGREKLTMNQIARLKMPRMIYSPQPLAIEKAWRTHVLEDDVDKLPLMPSLAGGSFLAEAEAQYDNFVAAMQGLVGQRVLDSIDESILTVQAQGMTKEQRQGLLQSIKQILERSKQVADEAVKTGRPFLGRIRHILPVLGEKQITAVQGLNSSGGSGAGRAGNISTEDVLFHAKVLCGALGTDITQLGFADQMSGGLGEGGFFRTSVQSAERSKTIREALVDFYNHIIEIHVAYRYGRYFEPTERPWEIGFFGTIAAMEAERQKTALDSAQTGLVIMQLLDQLKSSGLDLKAMIHFLTTVAKMVETDAEMYAKAIITARATEGSNGGGASGDDDGA